MSAIEQLSRPQYRVHFLDVKDADAIVIAYKKNALVPWSIALIDAGNVDDAKKIKDFLSKRYNTNKIDLAVVTHPDRDHKGGFFGLLEDPDIEIDEFWWRNPWKTIRDDEFSKMKKKESKQKACESCFNHPADSSKNLLELARKKSKCHNAIPGTKHTVIPLSVLGPSKELFHQAALGIVANFAELSSTADYTKYEEYDEVDETAAANIINEEVDESHTNTASIVMMFQPTENFKILLAGDASSASLRQICDNNKELIKGSILKVPHHGSRKNLNTRLIDDIQPKCAIISAAGNTKHPNKHIVRYLAKYCNVYSTHKSHEMFFTSEKVQHPAEELKSKIS